ncbi:MAG TPA: O-antigen ligase family protein, partial [Candidatus Limnocylindria bacterium]|nr:O-antigen ligase family protein [Candidatus Limnocylindria bacterium]
MPQRTSAKRATRQMKRQPKPRGSRAVSAAQGWREIALVLVCIEIAIFLLVFDPSVRNVFDLPKATLTHALAWVLLGVVVVVGLVDGVRVPVSPLFLAFYAVLAAELLTTATATNQYVAVFGEVGRYLGLTTHAVLALIAVAIAAGTDYPRRASWLAWSVAVTAVAASGYAFVQALGADPVRWADLDSQARPFATLGNPDFYGQFLSVVVIASAAALAFAWSTLGRLRWAIVALGIESAVLMIIVATRGSLIGLVAGLFVIALLWLRRTGITRRALSRVALAGAALVVALALVLVATPLGGRLLALADAPEVSGRLLIYQAAARIFADHPVLGVGFENFAVVYPQYEEAEGLKNNRTQTSAHSWLFHTAATTGIVGLATLAALFVTFAVHAWQRARDADATALLVATAGTAAFYGSGLVLPGAQSIQWIPWACLGIALASDLRTARIVARTPGFRVSGLVRLVLLVVLAGAAFLQLPSLAANRSAKTAETSLRAETATRAVAAAQAATAADPGRATYWNDLGRALELVDDQAAARLAYLEATARSPYTPAFWWNLGRMHLYFAQRGEEAAKDASYDAMRRAIAAAPRNSDTFDQFARIQLALGDLAGALESAERAIALYPGEPNYYPVAADAARRQGDV